MSQTPAQSHIKTRILVLSDTHSAFPSQNERNDHAAFRPPLPQADVLLHCGDLTMVGLMHEYETTLEMLKDIDAELKLVIAGNHDISLDEDYYARKGQYMQRLKEPDEDMPRRARELWTGDKAKEAGVTYLDEGTYSFTLKNGAKLRVRISSLTIALERGIGLTTARYTQARTSLNFAIGLFHIGVVKIALIHRTKVHPAVSPSPKIPFPTSQPST